MEKKNESVWIPKKIWVSRKLPWQKKLFLAEIWILDKEQGCYASNKYLAEFFDLSIERARKVVSELVKDGYLTRELIYGGDYKVKRRTLKINHNKIAEM